MKLDYYRYLLSQGPLSLSRGMPYARCVEYPEVLKRLQLRSEDSLLDVGSRYSPFPQIVGIKTGCSVVAIDPEPDFREKQLAMARRNPAARKMIQSGRLDFQVLDAASMPFPAGHFTRIAAISVLEHIVDERPVVAELARVLAPGGRMVVSVPYDPYRDEPRYYRKRAYVTGAADREDFYQRFYNDANLKERLITPSGLLSVEIARFGEPGFNAHNLLFGNDAIPWPVRRVFLQPFAPLLAPILIRPLVPSQFRRKTKMYTADVAILVLDKPRS